MKGSLEMMMICRYGVSSSGVGVANLVVFPEEVMNLCIKKSPPPLWVVHIGYRVFVGI